MEALAGGVDLTHLAATMVNDIDDNEELRRTYGPAQAESLRATAESGKGTQLMQESEHNRIKRLKLTPRKVETQPNPIRRQSAESLERNGFESGASDGARTRDLRRDRPAL